MNADLESRLRRSVEAYRNLSPEERRSMDEAQRQSWVRAFAPAGTGMTREQIEARIKTVEESISAATCWGAALTELGEELGELKGSLALRR